MIDINKLTDEEVKVMREKYEHSTMTATELMKLLPTTTIVSDVLISLQAVQKVLTQTSRHSS